MDIMPEVWLNYGPVDAVLDIRAENLGGMLEGDTMAISQERIGAILDDVSLNDSTVLVVLHDTKAVRNVVARLYSMCETRSLPFPRILADRQAQKTVATGLPEGIAIEGLGPHVDSLKGNMIFVAEMEPDGLFGYQTVCTRLMRRFGASHMLDALESRSGDAPMPGSDTPPYRMAQEFAEKFDVSSIEVAGGREGVYGLYVGHPSACDAARLAAPYMSEGANSALAVVGSSGRVYGNNTLAGALQSLWAMWMALKPDGQAVLLAECGDGLGSEALVRHSEGRLDLEMHGKYVEGIEDVLFARWVAQKSDVSLVTALPDTYVNRLGIRPARQMQGILDDILKKNPRRKIMVMPDAGRTILRQYARGKGGADNG